MVVDVTDASKKCDVDLEAASVELQHISDTEPMLANPQEDAEVMNQKKKSNGGRMSMKELFKKYGLLAVVVHSVMFLCTFIPIYLAFLYGIDVGALIKMIPGMGSLHLDSEGSTAVVAFFVTSATGLIRLPITIFGTPIIARYLEILKERRCRSIARQPE